MKIITSEFKEACAAILGAIDNRVSVQAQEDRGYNSLEIVSDGNGTVTTNITNGEYYVSVTVPTIEDEPFHAVVDAKNFLRLVSKLPTDKLFLEMDGNILVLKSSGTYKFPMKTDVNGNMLTVPTLKLSNEVSSFTVDGEHLLSMLKYNVREFDPENVSRPAQTMYYLDQDGCITWTNASTCVNSFHLPKPFKVFLSQKVVRLFKLFKDNDVRMAIGMEDVGAKVQTRVSFETDNIKVVSIAMNDAGMMESVPVEALRRAVEKPYKYSVEFDVGQLASAIQRLMIFQSGARVDGGNVAMLDFGDSSVTIRIGHNTEDVNYQGGASVPDATVTVALSVDKLNRVLEKNDACDILFNFGDNDRMVMLSNGTVRNIVQVLGR